MFACLNEMFYGYTGDLDNRGCKLQGKISSQALNKNFFTLKVFSKFYPILEHPVTFKSLDAAKIIEITQTSLCLLCMLLLPPSPCEENIWKLHRSFI